MTPPREPFGLSSSPSAAPPRVSGSGDSDDDWWRISNGIVAVASLLFAVVAFRASLKRRDNVIGSRVASPNNSGRSTTGNMHLGTPPRPGPRTPVGMTMSPYFPRTMPNNSGRSAAATPSREVVDDDLAARRIDYSAPSLHSSLNSDAEDSYRELARGGCGADTDDDLLLPQNWELLMLSDPQVRFYVACAAVGLSIASFSTLVVLQSSNSNGRVPTLMLLVAVYAEYAAVAVLLDLINHLSLDEHSLRQKCAHVFWPALVLGYVGCCVAACIGTNKANDALEYIDAVFAVILFVGCAGTAFWIRDVSTHMRAALLILAAQFCLRTVEVVPAVQNTVENRMPSNAFFALWCLELIGPLFAAFVCLHA